MANQLADDQRYVAENLEGIWPAVSGLEREMVRISEAAREIAAAFGVSVAEVADQVNTAANGQGLQDWNNLTDRNERAMSLLLSLLDDEQRKMFEEFKAFVVVGSKSKDRYLIYQDAAYNVMSLSTGHRYCATAAQRGMPFWDILASQLLMIECEEEVFHRLANQSAPVKIRKILEWLGFPNKLIASLLPDDPESSKSDKDDPRCSVCQIEVERQRRVRDMRINELGRIVQDSDAPDEARWQAARELQGM